MSPGPHRRRSAGRDAAINERKEKKMQRWAWVGALGVAFGIVGCGGGGSDATVAVAAGGGARSTVAQAEPAGERAPAVDASVAGVSLSKADGGGDQVNAGNQVNDFIADAADGIDAGDGIDLLVFTDDMNLIAMTGIQGIKYHLIHIGEC